MRWLVAVVLFAVILFCVFGFVASFEPDAAGSPRYGWMAGYSVLGVACLVAAGLLVFRRK